MVRIELTTSPLPRVCSTTELHGPVNCRRLNVIPPAEGVLVRSTILTTWPIPAHTPLRSNATSSTRLPRAILFSTAPTRNRRCESRLRTQ